MINDYHDYDFSFNLLSLSIIFKSLHDNAPRTTLGAMLVVVMCDYD